MKLILAILALIGLSFADCFFDSNLGRISCIEIQNASVSIVSANTMAIAFRNQSMNPFLWNQKIEAGLKKVIAGKLKIANFTKEEALIWLGSGKAAQLDTNSTSSVQIPPSAPVLAVAKPANNTTIGKCQSEASADWLAYCSSNLVGFDCFCSGCSGSVLAGWQATKDGIMSNMAGIKGCVYG